MLHRDTDPASRPPSSKGVTVERLLSRGPRGEVWLGHQHRPHRPVVVKFPTNSELLEREARLLLGARHPAFPALLAVVPASEEGPGHLILEWRCGVAADDPALSLNCEELLYVARALLEAITALHARGVVHGDLKPEHVLVDPERVAFLRTGEPAVSLLDLGEGRGAETDSRSLSRAGSSLYTAPELRAHPNRAVTPAADVYSAGLVLHQLVSGRNPLELHEVLPPGQRAAYQKTEVPPPSHWRSDCPAELDTIVLAALASEPDRRPSAADLRDAVLAHQEGRPIQIRRPRPMARSLALLRARPILRTSLLFAFLLLGIGLGSSLAAKSRLDLSAASHEEELERQRRLVADLLAQVRIFEERTGGGELRELLLDAARSIEKDSIDVPTRTRARLLHALGDRAAVARRLDLAFDHFEGALHAWTAADQGQPLTLEEQRESIITRIRMGDVRADMSLPGLAHRHYEIAHSLLESLVKAYPRHWGLLDDLGYSFERRAWLLLNDGRFPEAVPLIEERSRIATRVRAERGEDPSLNLKGIYQANHLRWRLARELGWIEEARQAIERKCAVAEEMVRLEPGIHELETRWIGARTIRLQMDFAGGSSSPAQLLLDLRSVKEDLDALLGAELQRSHVLMLHLSVDLLEIQLLAASDRQLELSSAMERLEQFLDEWSAQHHVDEATRVSLALLWMELAEHGPVCHAELAARLAARFQRGLSLLLEADSLAGASPEKLAQLADLLQRTPGVDARWIEIVYERMRNLWVEGELRTLEPLARFASIARTVEAEELSLIEAAIEQLRERYRAAGLEVRLGEQE